MTQPISTQSPRPAPESAAGLETASLERTSPPDHQRRILRLGALFFAAMAALTVLSRAASSLTVPVVETASPQSTFLSHSTSADGIIRPNGIHAVTVEQGLLVKDVLVQPGQTVAQGDPVLTVDPEDLEEQLGNLRLEVEKLQLQAQPTPKAVSSAPEDLALTRAQEDYEIAVQQHEQAVARARADLEQSYENWEKADSDHWDQIYYGEEGDEGDTEDDENYVNPYEEQVRSAQRAYQDAKAAQETALLEAQRKIEDAKLQMEQNQADQQAQAQTEQKSLAAAQLELEQKQRQLQKLEALSQAQGTVTAPADGTVYEVKAASGQRTGSEAAVTLTDDAAGCRLEATLTPEEARYLARGQEVTVTPSGGQPVKTTVASLAVSQSQQVTVTASLEGSGLTGMAATLSAEQKTENYSLVLPIGALHEDSGEKYVLRVEERQSILGTEQVAVRVPVTVKDQSATRVAVDGPLLREDVIIVSSSRGVSDGDRVRLGV